MTATIMAGRVLAAHLALILALQFLMGLFAALIGMANSRLAMAIIPPMGRNHFFVMYSVFASVTLGLAPILWGLIIDLIGNRQFTFMGIDWNHLHHLLCLGFARVWNGPMVVSTPPRTQSCKFRNAVDRHHD